MSQLGGAHILPTRAAPELAAVLAADQHRTLGDVGPHERVRCRARSSLRRLRKVFMEQATPVRPHTMPTIADQSQDGDDAPRPVDSMWMASTGMSQSIHTFLADRR